MSKNVKIYAKLDNGEYQLIRYTSNICCCCGDCYEDTIEIHDDYFTELPKSLNEISNNWLEMEIEIREFKWLFTELIDENPNIQLLFLTID